MGLLFFSRRNRTLRKRKVNGAQSPALPKLSGEVAILVILHALTFLLLVV